MKFVFRYIALLALASSCKEFSFPTFRSSDNLLARVGSERLYMDQIGGIFTSGMSHEDSVAMLKAHIDNWVERQIQISQAQELFQKDEADIKELLDNYYNSLLIYKFEDHISSQVDTVVDMSQILDHYADNRSKFRISSPIVKAKVLIIPGDYRDIDQIEEIFLSKKPEAIFDLLDLADKNNFRYEDMTLGWNDFNDVVKLVPFTSRAVDEFLKKENYYRVEDADFCYLLSIEDYRTSGDYAPLEMVESSIRREIIIKRRNERIALMGDSIHKQLTIDGEIEVRDSLLETMVSNQANRDINNIK